MTSARDRKEILQTNMLNDLDAMRAEFQHRFADDDSLCAMRERFMGILTTYLVGMGLPTEGLEIHTKVRPEDG
jgi:hypothetical protein